MKHNIIAVTAFVVFGSAAFAQTASFCSGEWEPFSGAALSNQGIASELVHAVCDAAGIEATINFYPWPRAESMVAGAEAFAAYPYALTAQRKEKYLLSDPIFYTSPRFVYSARVHPEFAAAKFADLKSFSKHTVAAVAGNFFENDLKANGIKIDSVTNLAQAVNLLNLGRVDFIVEEPSAVMDAVRKTSPSELDNYKALSFGAWAAGPNGLIVSKGYPGSQVLLDKFNAGLGAIRKSGRLDQIAAKYGLVTRP